MFKFCNLKVSDQTIDFINKSKSTSSEDPYDVFRKNKSNFEWKDLLDKKIVAEILSDPDFVKINNYFDW
ncbi:MAG TPA: hypothetical protein DEQ34_11210 [Balneolaceae bacterium]|nr:hypothetical protein [Balneolaceae bacterium]